MLHPLTRFWGIALTVAVTSAASAAKARGGEVINPGFELDADADGVPDGWRRAMRGSSGQTRLDDAVKRQGRFSVCVQFTRPDSQYLYCETNVKPGAVYRLSGWVRTKDLKAHKMRSWSGAFGTLAVRSTDPYRPYIECGEDHTGTSDWTRVTIDFLGPLKGRVTIACTAVSFARASGTVWFDDLELELLADPSGAAALKEPPSGCHARAEWALRRTPPDLAVLVSALDSFYGMGVLRSRERVDTYLDALRTSAEADPKARQLLVQLCAHRALAMPAADLLRLGGRAVVQEAARTAAGDPKAASELRLAEARAIALEAKGTSAEAAKAVQHAIGSDKGQRDALVSILARDAAFFHRGKDYERAERVHGFLLEFVDSSDPRRVALESGHLTFLLDTGRTEAATRAAEQLARPERKIPVSVRAQALSALAKLYLGSGRVEDAAKWTPNADQLLSAHRGSLASFRLDYAKALADKQRWEDAGTECQRLVASLPDQMKACFEAQSLLVECSMRQRRHDDALAAAKVLYGAAPNSEKEITEAVNLVMQALRAKYRSIALPNDFVAFQSHGPNGEDGKKDTEDDVENPLARVKWFLLRKASS